MSGYGVPESFFGHTPAVKTITTYECRTCHRELRKTSAGFVHEATFDDESQNSQQGRLDDEAKRLDSARPYSGAIKQCQAYTTTHGRMTEFWRCSRRSKYVTSETSWHDKSNPDPIAVCAQHVRQPSGRYTGARWPEGQGAATEQIEDEYRV